jgi:hypothetical protein
VLLDSEGAVIAEGHFAERETVRALRDASRGG